MALNSAKGFNQLAKDDVANTKKAKLEVIRQELSVALGSFLLLPNLDWEQRLETR